MKKIAWLMSALLLMAACRISTAPMPTDRGDMTVGGTANVGVIYESDSCEHGEWQMKSRSENNHRICVKIAKDEGKVCRDASDCESRQCLAKDNISRTHNRPITGQCPRTVQRFGCMERVVNGHPTGIICID